MIEYPRILPDHMASHEYRFVTRWHVPGTCEQVYAILEDTERVARFWPSLYHTVDVVYPGDAGGTGKLVKVVTRGFLPYVIRWNFRVTDSNRPYGFSIDADGDLSGTGRWTFMQDDDGVAVLYEWNVSASKPLLKTLSFLLRPLFAANHNWVMKRGEKGLRKELLASEKALSFTH